MENKFKQGDIVCHKKSKKKYEVTFVWKDSINIVSENGGPEYQGLKKNFELVPQETKKFAWKPGSILEHKKSHKRYYLEYSSVHPYISVYSVDGGPSRECLENNFLFISGPEEPKSTGTSTGTWELTLRPEFEVGDVVEHKKSYLQYEVIDLNVLNYNDIKVKPLCTDGFPGSSAYWGRTKNFCLVQKSAPVTSKFNVLDASDEDMEDTAQNILNALESLKNGLDRLFKKMLSK